MILGDNLRCPILSLFFRWVLLSHITQEYYMNIRRMFIKDIRNIPRMSVKDQEHPWNIPRTNDVPIFTILWMYQWNSRRTFQNSLWTFRDPTSRTVCEHPETLLCGNIGMVQECLYCGHWIVRILTIKKPWKPSNKIASNGWKLILNHWKKFCSLASIKCLLVYL